MSTVVPKTPPELEKLIARCLRKDPDRRIQHMGDVKLALEELKEESDSGKLLIPPPPRSRIPHSAIRAFVLLMAVGLAGAGFLLWWLLRPKQRPDLSGATSREAIRVVPLTTYPGSETSPTFSPDGRQVAFSWNGEREDNFDIYVKQVGPGAPLRLTTDPAADLDPAWSPDGKWIAFRRERDGATSEILLIPSLGGGPERKLAVVNTVAVHAEVLSIGSELSWGSGMSWSPDGKFLAVADSGGILLLSPETLVARRLSVRGINVVGSGYPVFSPDGRALAFVWDPGVGTPSICVQPLTSSYEPEGAAMLLARHNTVVDGLDWSPDGRSIVYSGSQGLWRIPAAGGTPERLGVVVQPAILPVVARQGNRLAFVQPQVETKLYRLVLPANGAAPGPPTPFAPSTRGDLEPHFSPDGKRVAFHSGRSGGSEIWVCDNDGSNCFQVTSFDGPLVGSPNWSPDNRRIAFDSNKDGSWDVYVIDVEGGAPRKLTAEPSDDARPSWSVDGKWVYFSSDRTGSYQVWKVPANGGTPVQVTRRGGFEAAESAGGQYLYYIKRNMRGIWRVPAGGGEETQVLDRGDEGRWALLGNHIYLLTEEPGGGPFLGLYDLSTKRLSKLAKLPKETARPSVDRAFTVSPDGRSVVYVQNDRPQADIMIVENFR